MIVVERTGLFDNWFQKLKDRKAKARIVNRIERMEEGCFGVQRDLGDGVSELKIDYGPGYRVYYCRWEAVVYVLLCGGDKRTQERDIQQAKEMRKCLLKTK